MNVVQRSLLLALLAVASVATAQQFSYLKTVPPAADARVKNAVSVAMGPNREYYIADKDAACIFTYDSNGVQGATISDVTVDGNRIAFKHPVDVTVDQRGIVYVVDEGLNKILVRRPDGTGMALGTEGSDLGLVSDVRSIAVNYNGYIYVLSGGTKRIDVFSPSGQYRSWIAGGVENFRKPIAIGISSDNVLYVLDKAGPAVYLFDAAGNYMAVNMHRENQAGVTIEEAADIAVLKNGDYFIVDADACKVSQFRRGGTPVGTMGSKGPSSKGVFEKAERIAANSSAMNVLMILDHANGQVQQFRVPTGGADLPTPAVPPEMKALETPIKPFIDLCYAPNDIHYIIPESDPSTVEGYNDSSSTPIVTFKVKKAVALAADDNANLFVLDNGAQEVITYDKQGVLIRRFGQEISDRLKDPTGLALLSDGSVIVADRSTTTVKRWTNAGVFDRTLISQLPNVMESPFKVKVDGKDFIYVWDDNLNAVARFERTGSQSGARLLKLRTSDASEDKGLIAGFAIDAYDQVHVFNATTSQYEVFKWDGVPVNVLRYGRPSEEACEGCFNKVARIGLDQRSFIGYVVSSKRGTVAAFKLPFVDYFGEGNRLFDAQRYDDAMAQYNTGLKRVGNKPYLRIKVARRFAALGTSLAQGFDAERGLTYLKFAGTLQPSDEKIRAALGGGYVAVFGKLVTGEIYKDIVPLATKLAAENERLKPFVLGPLDSLGQVLGDRQNELALRAAIGFYQKLTEWDSSGPLAFGLARSAKRYYDFKKTVGVSQLELTVQLSIAENYAKTANRLLSEKEPQYLAGRALYAEILVANRAYDAAIPLLVKELQKEGITLPTPMAVQLRQLLVQAYSGQARFELAETEAKRILALEPANKSYKRILAKAYIANRHFDEALALYQDLLNDDRKNAAIIGDIGKVQLMRKNFAEASFQLESALKIDVMQRDLFLPLAEAFDGDGKYQRALENYAQAIQYKKQQFSYVKGHGALPEDMKAISDDLARALTNVGNIQMQLGDVASAMKSYRDVLEFNQVNANVWLGLGKAYIAAGLVYDAIEALRKGQQLDPGSVEIGAALASATTLRDQMRQNAQPVDISQFQLDDLFPSLYRNYAEVSSLPIGHVTLTNNTSLPITGATVSLLVDQFMASATPQQTPAIVGLSNTTIRLAGVFKESILENGEDKQLQATVSLKYMYEGREKEIKKTTKFVLHGRNAIDWSDKRRMAAFVGTSNELVDFVKMIEVQFRDAPRYDAYKTILQAAQVYTVLHKLDFTYSPDPNVNYAKATTQADVLDYVQYPAETIVRKGGDCDDLVAVYCSLLECLGVHTAYIDVPGHVFMAFDTGIDTTNLESAGLDRRDVIVAYGTVWLPVETTMLGKQGFNVAWRYAAERYYKEITDQHFPEIVSFSDAHRVYQASTFIPKTFHPALPAKDLLNGAYRECVYGLLGKTLAVMRVELENRRLAEPANAFVCSKLGMLYVRMGQFDKAETAMLDAVRLSPNSGTFHNNLGDVYFMTGRYDKASTEFNTALEFERNDAEIYINLCKAQIATGNKPGARQSFETAIRLAPDVVERYGSLKEELSQ